MRWAAGTPRPLANAADERDGLGRSRSGRRSDRHERDADRNSGRHGDHGDRGDRPIGLGKRPGSAITGRRDDRRANDRPTDNGHSAGRRKNDRNGLDGRKNAGNSADGRALVIARALNRPDFTWGNVGADAPNMICTSPAMTALSAGAPPL